METKPLLRMANISKQFPGVQALDNVDFEVYPGEILGFVGENGAGKSTLIKILSGVYSQGCRDDLAGRYASLNHAARSTPKSWASAPFTRNWP